MQIGEYHVIRELGRGAMAVVFHAQSQRTGAEVALKILPAGKSARQRERFRREADALASLHHPNIVGVHGYGEENGSPYMAMELVPGEGLEERIERLGPLPVGYAVELFVPLARALGHAHSHGILHRDLKPANVLISAAGTPYLADFGLAKKAESTGADLTQEGALVGTPGFWSPEQARADRIAVGPPTDIYGLGATLYAALTGEPPLSGNSIPELMVAVQNRTPESPSSLRPEVPRALSRVVMRCLKKDPAKRYSSADALAKALASCLNEAPQSAAGARVALPAAIGVTLLALGAGTVWALSRGAPASPEVSTVVPPAADAAPTAEELVAEGRTLLKVMDPDRAQALFEAALELEPNNGFAKSGMGDVYLLRKDWYTAIDWLDRGLALCPEDGRGYLSRALAYAQLGKPERARGDFERAVEFDPKEPRAHHNYGVYLIQCRDLRGAERAFGRAIHLYEDDDPDVAQVRCARASIRLEHDDFTGAEEDVRTALAIDPDIERGHYMLGAVLHARKRWGEAARALQTALERTSPDEPQYSHIKKLLDEALAELGR